MGMPGDKGRASYGQAGGRGANDQESTVAEMPQLTGRLRSHELDRLLALEREVLQRLKGRGDRLSGLGRCLADITERVEGMDEHVPVGVVAVVNWLAEEAIASRAEGLGNAWGVADLLANGAVDSIEDLKVVERSDRRMNFRHGRFPLPGEI